MSIAKREMMTIVLTPELLETGMKAGRGLKRIQAKILGVGWPLVSGWKEKATGKVLSWSEWENFLEEGRKRKKSP